MNIYTTDKIRNVVLLGHGGSGKTSLAEAFGYLSGITSRMGKVDDGNTLSDYSKEEQKRHFSISTSVIPIEWEGYKINIIDTPGYFDFVGEVEEAVSAAGAAIIVVNGKSGIEVGTQKAWELCEKYKLPRFIYVSNMDVDNASFRQVVEDMTTLTKKMAEDLTDFLTEQGIKVKYMHHEVDTFERMEIIKDLRLGSIDVVVGINLLREGLDLPEVSLVAILDADKEGFLRSETSLIQTIGRAARNAEGLVIMYADEVTDSMERAITETERRRAIQMAYNEEHGIVPKTIVKAIADSIEISDKAENAKRNTRRMGKLEREAAIERLTREMKEAAKLLEFEHAAFLRDQIDRLRRGENPTVDSDAETERRQNHAQTQRRGRKYLGKR